MFVIFIERRRKGMDDNRFGCGRVDDSRRRRRDNDLDDIEDLLKKIICLLKDILDELEEDKRRKC